MVVSSSILLFCPSRQHKPFRLFSAVQGFILCTVLWSWQEVGALRSVHIAPPPSIHDHERSIKDMLQVELKNFKLELAKSEATLLGNLAAPRQRPSRSVDIAASSLFHPFSFPTGSGSYRDIVVEEVDVHQSFSLPGVTDLQYLEYGGHKFITVVTGDGRGEVYQFNMTIGHFERTAELDINGGGDTVPNRFLGMSTGEIPNARIKASSSRSKFHRAHQARLHLQETARTAGAWVARYNDRKQWLQVDLGQVTQVLGIITQGRNSNPRSQDSSQLECVTLFKVQYSNDGGRFTTYKDNLDTDVEFSGNSDQDTTQVNMFVQGGPITAQYIRVVPVQWKNNIAMRIELLGKEESIKQLTYFEAAGNCFGEGDLDLRQYCAVLSDYSLRIYEVIMPFFILVRTPLQTVRFSYQAKGLHLFHTVQGTQDPLYLLVLPEKATTVSAVDGQATVPVYRWHRKQHTQCSFQHMKDNPVVPETGQDAESFFINSELFMVIAQHSDKLGQTLSESSVLKFNPHSAVFQHFQSLHVNGASDVEYFRIGQNPYLTLAAHSTSDTAAPKKQSSYIFKWNGYSFEVVQTIAESSQIEAISVPGCEQSKLLALIHPQPPHTSLFLYNNQQREFQIVHQQLQGDVSVGMVSFVHHGLSYLAVAHTNLTTLYRLRLAAWVLPSWIGVERGNIMDSMAELKTRASQLSTSVEALRAHVAENIVKKTGDQFIKGKKHFSGNVTMRHLVAKNTTVIGTTLVDVPERPLFREKMISIDTIKAQVGAQQAVIKGIKGILQDAVAIDVDQEIPRQLVFQDEVVFQHSLSAQKMTVKTLNGLNIPQLQQELVGLDRESEILGSMTFAGDVVIMGDLNINGTYSGVDLSSDAMTVGTTQTITGSVVFSNDVTITGDVEVMGTVNDVDLSEDVVTLAGNHSIGDEKSFLDDIYLKSDLIVANGSTVDQVDVDRLFKNVMTVQGDQIIRGAKRVRGNLTVLSDLTITGTMNDMDISDMDERVIRLDEAAVVSGHKTFVDDVEVYGDIDLRGHLNDVDLMDHLVILRDDPSCRFPLDYVNKTSMSCSLDDRQQPWCSVLQQGQELWNNCRGVITGPKTFSGNVTLLGDLYVAGTIDGTDLSEDTVTLTGSHIITGKKSFCGGLTVLGAVQVEGLVDRVDLLELQKNVVTLTTDQQITGPFTFQEGVNITENMRVSGEVDGVDMSDLAEDAIYINDLDIQEVQGLKTFSEDVNVTKELILTGTVNGFNMKNDFVLSTGDQTITGHKTFTVPSTINGNLTVNSVDSVNLTQLLHDMVTLSGHQVIGGHKLFIGGTVVEGDLVIDEDCTLNSIDLSEDSVLLNGGQNISGRKIFQRGMVVDGVLDVQGDLQVDQQVNGVNLHQLASGRVTLSTHQVISGKKAFSVNVTVEGGAQVTGTVNELQLGEFVEDVMLSSTLQTVLGRKTFLGQVTVEGNAVTNGTIDCVDISVLMEEVIYIHKEQNITGKQVFSDPVVIWGDLTAMELVDGVNVTQLNQDIIYMSQAHQTITGALTFEDGFHVEGDIHVTSMVQGIDISEDLWTASTDQVVTGQYVFQDSVTVHGDLEVEETVNGLDLSEAVLQWMTLDDPQDLDGDIRFEKTVYVLDELRVTGTVNALNPSECIGDAVMVGGDRVISGTKHFPGHVTIHGDLFVEKVNGMELPDFVASIVTVQGNQVITGTKTFMGEMMVNSTVTVSGNMFVRGQVDGMDLTLMEKSAISLDGQLNVRGCKSFSSPEGVAVQGDIISHGKVNSITVADMVTMAGAQMITGEKTFLNGITVNGHIHLTDVLDGVNLVEMEAGSLKVSGKQLVRGRKVFLSDVTVTANVIMASGVQLNGLDVSREAATLDTDQSILGSKNFQDQVVIQGDVMVHGQVTGQDLVKLMVDPRLSSDQTIYGDVVFLADVVFQQEVFIHGTVNGISLDMVTQDQQTCYNAVYHQTRKLQEQAQQQCQDISTLLFSARDAMEVIHHFVLAQSFPIYAARSFQSFHIDGTTWLAAANLRDGNGFCTTSPLYTWDVTTSQFVQTDSKLTNGASAWHHFSITEGDHHRHFLVMANQALQSCPEGLSPDVSQLFEYNPNFKNFTLHQNLTTYGAKDFVSFCLGTDTYLAVANSDDIRGGGMSAIFIWENQQFQLHWSIPTAGAQAVDTFEHNGTQFLVYANSKLLDDLQTQVFVYDAQQMEFRAIQTIPTSSAADVAHFVLAGLPHLVVADMYEVGLDGINNYNMHIKVYRWSQRRSEFVWTQTMHFEAASDVAVFYRKNDIYLAAVSLNTAVMVYRHEGVSGFLPVVTIPAHGARSVQPLSINGHLFLAIAQDPLDTTGQSSSIFKAVMTGASLESVGDLCETSWLNGAVGLD